MKVELEPLVSNSSGEDVFSAPCRPALQPHEEVQTQLEEVRVQVHVMSQKRTTFRKVFNPPLSFCGGEVHFDLDGSSYEDGSHWRDSCLSAQLS